MAGRPRSPLPLPDAAELLADGSLGVRAAAAFAGVSRTEIYDAMARGELEWFRHGRHRLIPKKLVVAWQAARLEKARRERQGLPA